MMVLAMHFPQAASKWLLDVTRIIAGITLSVSLIIGLYLTFYDPMTLDGVRAEVLAPDRLLIFMTGKKRHDNCPGDWQILIEGASGFITESRLLSTGRMAVGQFVNVPREVVLKHELPGGRHVGQMIVTYHCQVDFRHLVSFPIIVPPGPP